MISSTIVEYSCLLTVALHENGWDGVISAFCWASACTVVIITAQTKESIPDDEIIGINTNF